MNDGVSWWLILTAIAALAWWLWRRRRSPERKAANLRARMGYGAKRSRDAMDWRDLINRPDVLIVDTETTGFGNRAEVIEVAVLDTCGTLRYESLSLPQGRIPRAASDIHGLTRAKLKAEGARPWPEIHGELVEVLDGAAEVLSWNARFDWRLLAQTADRHGLTLPRLPWYDLLEDYRAMTGEAPRKGRHTLTAAVKRTGATGTGPAHRAAGDCRRVLAVMRAAVG